VRTVARVAPVIAWRRARCIVEREGVLLQLQTQLNQPILLLNSDRADRGRSGEAATRDVPAFRQRAWYVLNGGDGTAVPARYLRDPRVNAAVCVPRAG